MAIDQTNGPLSDPGADRADVAHRHELALLGHDLRAALAEVQAGLQLIEGFDVPARLRERIDRCVASGESLSRLIDQSVLVCLGQAPPGLTSASEVEATSFLQTLRKRWANRAAESGHSFDLVVVGAFPTRFRMDQTVFDRVLTNLVINALVHTPPGTIHVSLAVTDDKALSVSVTDDGPGLEAAHMQIFDPVALPSAALPMTGHGLGLHSVNSLLRAVGGTINIRNIQKGGVRITVDFPLEAVDPSSGPDVARPAALPDLGGVRVLVVDDNATSREVVALLASRAGAEVKTVDSGPAALAELQRCLPDILILDDEMPGLAGHEVLHQLRDQSGAYAELPVLAITSHLGAEERARLYAAGATAVLTKPLLSATELGHAILAAIGRPQGGTPPFDPSPLLHLCQIAGPEVASELLQRLEADLQAAQSGLMTATQAGDMAAIAAQTHVIIALAGTAGAMPLHEDAMRLNAMAHGRASTYQLAKLARQMDAGLGSLLAALGKARSKGLGSA